MSWLDDAIADLKRDEGLQLEAYQDNGGVWTIGYGHTGAEVTPGLKCSIGMATLWLQQDWMNAKQDLEVNCPWFESAPDSVKRGLLNMSFNLGWPRLAEFKLMLHALANGRYGDAVAEALKSKWAYQVGTRAVRIAELFESAAQLELSV